MFPWLFKQKYCCNNFL